MPPFRRPPRTLISGIGAAASVLAAVVAAFAVASGIVAYSLTSVDPLPRLSGALVLDPVRTGVIAAKPLVLRPTAHRHAAAPAGARRAAVVASVPVRDIAADDVSLHPGRPSVTPTQPQGGGDAERPAPSAQLAPARLPEPVGDAIDETGHAVGARTDSLATVTTAVAAHTEPIAGVVAAVANATMQALRATVDRSGQVVGRLLGDSPPR
jgi:hypothetical protein